MNNLILVFIYLFSIYVISTVSYKIKVQFDYSLYMIYIQGYHVMYKDFKSGQLRISLFVSA